MNTSFKKLRSVIAAAGTLMLLGMPPLMAADPLAIGLNFVSSDENSSLNADAIAGAVPHGNWNNVSQKGPNEEEGFMNSRGEPVALKIEWKDKTATRGGHSTALQGEPDPDRKLIVATVSTPLTLTGIPPEFVESGYSIYVYFQPHDSREWPLRIQISQPADEEMEAEVIDTRWALMLKQEDLNELVHEPLIRTDGYFHGDGQPGGNYVAFEGLKDANITITSSRWIDEGTVTGGRICAIQIVAN